MRKAMPEASEKLMIARATAVSAGQLASLHEQQIKTAFLSRLGTGFLETLYATLIGSADAFCFVAEADGVVAGYVCGCVDTPKFYREFLRRRWPAVLLTLA